MQLHLGHFRLKAKTRKIKGVLDLSWLNQVIIVKIQFKLDLFKQFNMKETYFWTN